jgi:HEAT repeat protein
VRVGVVEVLSRLRTPECVPLLLRVAADDAEADVRYEALQEIGAVADPRARAVVEAALDDPAPKVRLAAAKGCAQLCTSPAALARLVRIAVADQPFPNAIWARASLVRMLAEKDGERAAQARAAIEDGARPVLGGTAPLEERARAGLLLAELGDAGGAAALAEAAAAAEAILQLRLYAAWALGRVGGAGWAARLDGGPSGPRATPPTRSAASGAQRPERQALRPAT